MKVEKTFVVLHIAAFLTVASSNSGRRRNTPQNIRPLINSFNTHKTNSLCSYKKLRKQKG